MKNFKSVAPMAMAGESLLKFTPSVIVPHQTDWDQIFGAAFGRHLYSTYQVLRLWVLPARHKLIKCKQ